MRVLRWTLLFKLLCIIPSKGGPTRHMYDASCKASPFEYERDVCAASRIAVKRSNDALAVVPYEENGVLPHLKPHREFTFVKRRIKITQNWTGLGVAAVVWDAAVVLSEYLERNPQLVEGFSVVELGAGCGLAGMVASLLGGKVLLTDRQEALGFLRQTVEANIDQTKHSLQVRQLDWREDIQDWATPDVILGADIIYVEDTFSDLLRTLQHLSDTHTLILLSCRIRYKRDSTFLQLMDSFFNMTKVLYDNSRDIAIYSARKKEDE